MKIKLTLRGRTREDIDLLVTTDATATVGDVAAVLAAAGPEGAAPAIDPESVTLRILDPIGGRVVSVLPSTAFVTETVLHSGSLIDIASTDGSVPTGGVAGELRILAGPDKGMRVPLPFGGTVIGRSPSCAITLADPRVSKKHARITVGSGIEIRDLNSANGTILGDQRVHKARVKPDDIVTLGDTQIQLIQTRQPESVGESTDIAFNRPPQVLPRVGTRRFKLPDLPEHPEPTRFPVIALLMPLVMGAVMFAITRQLYSVLFVALSPLMMLGSSWDQKRQAKKALEVERLHFDQALKAIREELQAHQDADREARHSQFPPIDQVIAGALRRDGSLWLRRPEHPEFLKLRLGIGTDLSKSEFEDHGNRKGLPDCLERVRQLRAEFSTISDVPVVADLRAAGSLGLCGAGSWLEQVQMAIGAQIAAEYSPAEVVTVCMTSNSRVGVWDWLEWLPHAASPHSPLGSSIHLAADSPSCALLLEALEGVLEARISQGQSASSDSPSRSPRESGTPLDAGVSYPNIIPAVIVFVDDATTDIARLNRIAELGPDHGIYFVWSASNFANLPAACRSFVAVEERTASIGDVSGSRVLSGIVVDRVGRQDIIRLARSLAPVIDGGVPVDDDSDLPGAISYVTLTGKELADNPEAVIEHWRASHSIIDRTPGALHTPVPEMSMAALVGMGAGAPLHLDLRTQGPHALVGGTTGAGKSEFLQAWVLGMAQTLSPDRLSFLFVDYKGGSAFGQCTELPHFVGLVTDLSPFLVRRALTSLRAELTYRERLLNSKGAKDLVTLEKSGDPDCPPSLIIVVDEFAALVSEVPEFVDGVVDVAQRGRSLGLHLILATQRPSGVIKDNLRANTNLRVALRMADTDDSQDVLGDTMAAHFPQSAPGRAAAKTGPGRISVFQSGYPGAKTVEDVKTVSVEVEQLGFGLTPKWHTPKLPRPGDDVATDIQRVVATLKSAAAMAGIPQPRKPWLSELAPTYDISELKQRRDSELVLGVLDAPAEQDQITEYFFPDKEGNIAYYGASGSGKTQALRSLAVAAAITPNSGPVEVYGLDFAGGGLDMIKVMPHVGDVVPGDDEERVTRLLTLIGSIVDDRASRYSKVRASDLTFYRKISGKKDEPRLLLLVDGIGAFSEEYQSTTAKARLWTRFQQILLDGRAVGVHVAVTADRTQAIPTSLASNFQRKIVLRMTDEESYLNLGLPKDVLTPTSPPGRAMQVGNPNVLQLAVLGSNVNPLAQARMMEEIASIGVLRNRVRPTPIGSLPTLVTADSIPASLNGYPVIGMEAEALAPLSFRAVGTLAIGGGPQTGRSNALAWLVHTLHATYPYSRFLHASSGRSTLAEDPVWESTARGADAVAELLTASEPFFQAPAPEDAPGVVLVIEGLGDFTYGNADQPIQNAIVAAKQNGHLVIAEADLPGWSRSGSLGQLMRGGRAGLVLCPSLGDGDGVVGTPIPGLPGREMSPGRGFFTQNGKIWKVQLPRM